MEPSEYQKYLSNQRFPGLNIEQKEQIISQLLHLHFHSIKKLDLIVSTDLVLNGFYFYPGVMQPFSSMVLAKYIWLNRNKFHGKKILDLGAGTGLLGIVAQLAGAKSVDFSDINPSAIENTKTNAESFKGAAKQNFIVSDLFESITDSYDSIFFAQPYFGSNPLKAVPVSYGMLDNGELIQTFFIKLRDYLKGTAFMIYWDFVGDTNNPFVVGLDHGFQVEEVYSETNSDSLQEGMIRICRITS